MLSNPARHPAPLVSEPRAIRGMIEDALARAVERGTAHAPPTLRAALRHAVFPGGARLRPQLCMAVASACGEEAPSPTRWQRALASASAIELVHCASLVHDDLPCFDDAELRRGVVTVHRRFGEATAVLVGDGLIVLAFETLAHAGAHDSMLLLASATGPSRGIIAGQAWESEPEAISLDEYHRAKTGALFEAAAAAGALAAGLDPHPWKAFGELVGRAYQAADDVADVCGDPREKTAARDETLKRPSLVRSRGVAGARARVQELVSAARRALPSCRGDAQIAMWLDAFERKLTRF